MKAARERGSNGLTAVFVRQKKAPGRYGDGNGVYLVVDPSGASRWVLRIMCGGRRRDIGLGGSASVSLVEARDKAHELRRLAKNGEDPVAALRALREGLPTFEECARTVHKNRSLRGDRHGNHTDYLKRLHRNSIDFQSSFATGRLFDHL